MIGPEQVVAEHRRKQRRDGVIWLVLALVLAMVLGFTYRTDHRADESDKRLSSSGAQVEDLKGQVSANGQLAQSAKDAADEANRRLAAAGKPTVPVPTEAPISPSVTPPPRQDEFTAGEAAAVRLIVADMIARTPAKLTQAEVTQVARVAAALVPKPKDGKTPTAAELQPIVTATLAAYCAGDRCVGEQGGTGAKGDPGDKGNPGTDAPAVTDEQLLTAAQKALAAYCAQDSKPCKGEDGKDAPPPYSVVDQDCVGDGPDSYWRIYLSNGTDQKELTSKGPCRIGPDLKPTE